MSEERFSEVRNRILQAENILLATHLKPDGDAIGSSLGLYHFLLSQDKTVHVIVPNAFPDFLRWMPGAKDVIVYNKYKEYADKLINEADVVCCLDFNVLSRIDEMEEVVKNTLRIPRAASIISRLSRISALL